MPAPPLERPSPGHAPGPSLLIVEDDPALRQMLVWDFQDIGYRVEAVGSVREARQALTCRYYQYALLDNRLPDGSGQDLLTLLPGLQTGIRAVLLSSGLSRRQAREARLAGARAVLTKPVCVGQLDRHFRS